MKTQNITNCERFSALGEYYAAGFFEDEGASRFERFSRAMRRFLEKTPLPEYNGGALYPCGTYGDPSIRVFPTYSYTMQADTAALAKADAEAAVIIEGELSRYHSFVPSEHKIGGDLYTHSFPNFRRIVREGLDSYAKRISKMKNGELRRGLTDIIEGIRAYHARACAVLEEGGASQALIDALKRVPFSPAGTLYEALVCWNFIYYLDGCDNVGRLDADLIDFYRGEDVTDVLREFFINVDVNNGWSGALGPHYNPLTLQCLKAIKGLRRPSLELRVTPDMPSDIWEAAIESVRAGGGQPSFYNECAYQSALARLFPEIPECDRLRFSGGGCTETMLCGISNVGSLDAGINVALIFERVMREELPTALDFEDFYGKFINKCRSEIKLVLDAVSSSQRLRSEQLPQPMRTLLIDDCIERECDFNAGGARYYWSVINLAGTVNVLDSLLVIEHTVFKNGTMTASDLLAGLDAGESFLGYKDIPRHGTDDPVANALAARLCDDLCYAFDGEVPYLGGKFLPSSIQFATYTDSGRAVGATPDGRGCGAPLCDCIGAVHGNDKKGITALLNSAAAIGGEKMSGTPVLNVRLDPKQALTALRPLVLGYFANGGMQIQITSVSTEDMLDALDHPERHESLTVRIGGYSEYFNRLTPQLKKTVIERTLHDA